jgi:hypothetical protein
MKKNGNFVFRVLLLLLYIFSCGLSCYRWKLSSIVEKHIFLTTIFGVNQDYKI